MSVTVNIPTQPLIEPYSEANRLRGTDKKQCDQQLEDCQKAIPFGDVKNGELDGHVLYSNQSGSRCGECNMKDGKLDGRFDYYGYSSSLQFSAIFAMDVLSKYVVYKDRYRYIYYEKPVDGQYSYALEDLETNEIIRYNVDPEGFANGPAVRIANGQEKKVRFVHGVEKTPVVIWPYICIVCAVLLVSFIVLLFFIHSSVCFSHSKHHLLFQHPRTVSEQTPQ